MQLTELIYSFERGTFDKIQEKLKKNKRNLIIDMWRDYYDGDQWMQRSNTTKTRSGKEMWKVKDPKDKGNGLTEGELKIWNMCDSVVDIYTSYVRGDKQDFNRIMVIENEKIAEELNDKIKLDQQLVRTTHRMSIDSVSVSKYGKGGSLEFIDSKEIFPIYDGEIKVGTIRMYELDKHTEDYRENVGDDEKTVWYTEVWYPEKGVYKLRKYIDDRIIDDGVAPFDFDPYILTINKNSEFHNFDEECLEISDVGKVLDLQDDLNSMVTDIGLVSRRVALPMFKIADSVYEMILEGKISGDAVRESLDKLVLVAGRIYSAPIDKIDGSDLPNGIMQYVDKIYEQLYRTTGITKTIFTGESGQAALKTVERRVESLRRRVDEKRANLEMSIKEYASMYAKEHGVYTETFEDSVEIAWTDMFGTSKQERSELLLEGFKTGVLPETYTLEEMINILGDQERFNEILGEKMTNNGALQIEIEKRLARDEERSRSEKVIQKSALKKDKAESRARQAEKKSGKLSGENSLLRSELDNLSKSI